MEEMDVINDAPQDTPQAIPQDTPQDAPQDIPQDISQDTPQDISQDTQPEEKLKTVRCRNSHNGVVYVYTYETYFDPVQQKYRQHRHCIGKVDPESGEVVPTAQRGSYRDKSRNPQGEPGEPGETREERKKRKVDERIEALSLQVKELKEKVQILETELAASQREVKKMKESKERLVDAVKTVLNNY